MIYEILYLVVLSVSGMIVIAGVYTKNIELRTICAIVCASSVYGFVDTAESHQLIGLVPYGSYLLICYLMLAFLSIVYTGLFPSIKGDDS